MTYDDALRATAEWMWTHIPDGYGDYMSGSPDDHTEDAAELLKVIGYEAMWGRIQTLLGEVPDQSRKQQGLLVIPDVLFDQIEKGTPESMKPSMIRKSEYEKMISPPGSGQDGLLADINREKP